MSTRDGFEPRRACSREKGVNKSSASASIPVLANRIHGAAQNRRDSTQSEIRIRGAPSPAAATLWRGPGLCRVALRESGRDVGLAKSGFRPTGSGLRFLFYRHSLFALPAAEIV